MGAILNRRSSSKEKIIKKIKLDDYVGNKLSSIKTTIKNNKTLLSLVSVIGTLYLVKAFIY